MQLFRPHSRTDAVIDVSDVNGVVSVFGILSVVATIVTWTHSFVYLLLVNSTKVQNQLFLFLFALICSSNLFVIKFCITQTAN